MGKPLVAVIATHQRLSLLERTLVSMAAAAKPSNWEGVIVVENGMPAVAQEVVDRLAASLPARYLHVETTNKNMAINCALQLADERLCLFFDDDVRLHPDTLVAYADAAQGFEGGRFFGGPVQMDYVVEPPQWLLPWLPASARPWLHGGHRMSRLGKQWFLGGNWAAYQRDLQSCGGFDSSVGPGSRAQAGSEVDMQQRLRNRGVHSLFVPEAVVWHYVPPERCSPEWVLARVRTSGIALGQAMFRLQVTQATVLLLKRLAWMTTLLLKPAPLSFKRNYYSNFWAGLIQGLALRRER